MPGLPHHPLSGHDSGQFGGSNKSWVVARRTPPPLPPSASGERPWFAEPPKVRKSWISPRIANRLKQLKNYSWVYLYVGAFGFMYFANLFIQRVKHPDLPANLWEWNKMKAAGLLSPELLQKEYDHGKLVKARMEEDPYAEEQETRSNFFTEENIKATLNDFVRTFWKSS